MLLLRPAVVRKGLEIQAQNPPVAPTLDTSVAAPAPVAKTQSPPASFSTLEAHGKAAWDAAFAYVNAKGVASAHSEFAAMVLLRVTHDIAVVELKAGKELPVLHPAFSVLGPFLNEQARCIPFSRVATQALKSARSSRYSIYASDGELVARSPSWRYSVHLRGILQEPWYTAVKMVGQQAMSAPNLNRFHYEAKLYLIPGGAAKKSAESSRIMIQSRRRESEQMRQFKGNRESWLPGAE